MRIPHANFCIFPDNMQKKVLIISAPPKQSARSMRPLWRDLILKVWGADPLQCPCYKAPVKIAGAIKRPEQIEFFLRLHGLWQGIIQLPLPPPPPFDIERMEPIEPPWQAIKKWTSTKNQSSTGSTVPGSPMNLTRTSSTRARHGKAPEIHLDDGRILVLESSCERDSGVSLSSKPKNCYKKNLAKAV